ncbi:unnamed protein product [Penicillium pancosmium]
MADRKNAFLTVSNDNRGAIITVTSVAFLIVAIIFVLAKFGSAIYFKQRRSAVNIPIWIALILAFVQVIILQKSVDHGLGKHQDRLSESEIQSWSKFAFTGHILHILVLTLTKLSTILLVWKLTPNKSLRRTCAIASVVVAGWAIFSVMSIAFQCEMPDTWLYSPERCAGEGALFYPIAIFNILTEIAILVIPFMMMRNVQMAWHKRVKILSSFTSRLSIVALGIVHLALLPSFVHSNDVSWKIVDWEIVGQTMMLTSIIIACIPTLYHILAGLHSGLTTTEIPDAIGLEGPRTKGSAYVNQSWSGASQSQSKSRSRSRSHGRQRKNGRSMFDGWGGENRVITEVSSGQDPNQNDHPGRHSDSSEGTESTRHLTHDHPGRGAVLRTVDVTVEIEEQGQYHRDQL